MKKIKSYLSITILSLFVLCCKKPAKVVPASGIYVAGALHDASETAPAFWQGNNSTRLGSSGNETSANSIFIANGDVYAVGDEQTASLTYNIAKIWKNGTATNLSDGSKPANLNAVFVSGSDVYIAGYDSYPNIAKVWKNNSATNLTNGTNSAIAYSVFVSGSDVYVSGYEQQVGGAKPRLWKNGVSQTLGGANGYAYAVAVSGTDVYATGISAVSFAPWKAVVWKNGVISDLPSGSSARGIFVDGDDVYISGGANGHPALWKNGVLTELSSNSGYARSVFVKEGVVYVAGEENINGVAYGRVWKDGSIIHSESNASFFNSIFVTE